MKEWIRLKEEMWAKKHWKHFKIWIIPAIWYKSIYSIVYKNRSNYWDGKTSINCKDQVNPNRAGLLDIAWERGEAESARTF